MKSPIPIWPVGLRRTLTLADGGRVVGVLHVSGELLLWIQANQPTSNKIDASCDLNQVHSHVQSHSRSISIVFCYNP